MRCQTNLDLGNALRNARRQQGLSQRRLALRTGTSQDAISRIERGAEAPTLERFAQLMLALGRQCSLDVEPLEGSVPESELSVAAAMTPGDRLREAASWNLVASRLAAAGARARSEGHPATRRNAP